MTAIQRYEKKTAEMMRSPAEVRMEEERMRDILLLLDSLFRREETSAKLILNCLYDIGSVNLINHKFRSRPVNQLMKWIARFSKPVFSVVALRWVKQNSPQLIAHWMHSKVTFEDPEHTPEAAVVEAEIAATSTSEELATCAREILRLRSQVRTLTALLIGVTVSLGSVVVWSTWRTQESFWRPISQPGVTAVPASGNRLAPGKHR
ncbi:hypothetical protein J5X98_21635 [Leptothermofonsia sichuanensis E412]|uniref:hypothetical protein n=1 Tax=Leptothermofonsia sichuanensis TaxID=2917832 RepID=UPI001CA79B24|nr:hypothetical protein [Leptothermofonsia sichuanensis]QZZ19881.1 hypothetical protein J5X98_21635 [Leptothermofonsia sichuanensis E412]